VKEPAPEFFAVPRWRVCQRRDCLCRRSGG